MELAEILKMITEIQKHTESIFLTIFIAIVSIYIKFRKKINEQIKKVLKLLFLKNKKEHEKIFERFDSLVQLIENGKIEKKEADIKMQSIEKLLTNINTDNKKIIEEQKRMNYIMKTIIQNKSKMEEKLIEGIKIVDYVGNDEIDVPFKAAFVEIPKLIAKFYTELRKQKKNMISYEDREKATSAMKLIFQEKNLFTPEKLKSILSFARTLLNEFNERKRESGNMELIIEIYGSFIRVAYEDMLKSKETEIV